VSEADNVVQLFTQDVFSVFLQLCADHLLGTSPGNEEKKAFDVS
jgi:hypothetical protein